MKIKTNDIFENEYGTRIGIVSYEPENNYVLYKIGDNLTVDDLDSAHFESRDTDIKGIERILKYNGYKNLNSSLIKSARFIIEDENGEVIASADTYEEAESVGGTRIIDTIKSSSVGDIHDKFVLGDITKKDAFEELKELVGIGKARSIIDRWSEKRVMSKYLNSSVERAVKEAEEYFGTEASDTTVCCSDIITNKDCQVVKEIAEKNNVQTQIGTYSVTFYEE